MPIFIDSVCSNCSVNSLNSLTFFQAPPSSPEKFHYAERTKSSLSLTWRPPRNDGGSPIIGYIIEKKRTDETAFVAVNKDLCTDLFMTVPDLQEMFMYEFRAKAVNAIGTSEPSITMTVVIQDDEGMCYFSTYTNITYFLNAQYILSFGPCLII